MLTFLGIYLAVGVLNVAHGWVRGRYTCYIQKRPRVILGDHKKGRERRAYADPVRLRSDWLDFFVVQAMDFILWPLQLLFKVLVWTHESTGWVLSKLMG